MKILLLSLPLALFVGCATPQPPTEQVEYIQNQVPGTQLPESTVDAVRNPESVREYGVNPAPDDNDPEGIRHDGHKVQRVEKKSTWNLYNDQAQNPTTGPAPEPVDPAAKPNPYMAQLEQELVKQRNYTAAALEQAKATEEIAKTLREQAENSVAILRENQELKKRIEETDSKVRKMEQQKQAEQSRGTWAKIKNIFTKEKNENSGN